MTRTGHYAVLAAVFTTLLMLVCEGNAKEKTLESIGLMNPYPRYQKFHDGGNPGNPLYLTPLILNKTILRQQIRDQAKVVGSQYHNIESYSGLLTVEKKYNSNMFFWYFPSEENPAYAPVVLWLQGGPGASSLFGLFAENGPFVLEKHNKLQRRNFTWSKTHNLIYIDNPVGTGFSYTDSETGYARSSKDVGRNLHEAMQQLYELFEWSDLSGFWLTGESYAGKYIPALAHEIIVAQNVRVTIPFKGIAIGNGFSDPIHQVQYGDYLYQVGFIDEHGLNNFHVTESEIVRCISQHKDCAYEKFKDLIYSNGSFVQNLTGLNNLYNYLYDKSRSNNDLGDFIQSTQTRRSIHVGNLSFHDSDGQNNVEKYLQNDFMNSVAHLIEDVLQTHHVCIYNGQLDIIVAYPLTVNYLMHLHFPAANYYKAAPRKIWRVEDEIAGYTKHAGNLIEVMVRNAGHMVPVDQPHWMYNLIYQLTHNQQIL